MKKFIVEVLHEEIIPEENLLSITGGAGEEGCGNTALCNVLILPSCPQLSCIGNCPSKGAECITKDPGGCQGYYNECQEKKN